ncbi:MAG: ATP-binding protein [Sedimentisphaerales bacterium]|nr:ATP-binding protein [Sedimentisphaerales bacterium]
MAKQLTIAIASGKGGTGKTTIATNLAKVIAEDGKGVYYADCDVEEPNGHIFLKPQIEQSRTVTVPVPQVDENKCTDCGKCGEVCQYGAIVHLGNKKVLTFDNLCHSCAGCWMLCPAGAITQKKMEIGIIESGNSGDIHFAHGKLRIGNIRSVSLINQLKQSIKARDLVILDVPPGTSCPVVESLKNVDFVILVTEPTPFGLNDLKLAVDLVRKMEITFAVVINRDGIGDDKCEKYCQQENISILMKLPDDRRIAEAYSVGKMVVDALPEYRKDFTGLYENILQEAEK